jgi:hypothetical protein
MPGVQDAGWLLPNGAVPGPGPLPPPPEGPLILRVRLSGDERLLSAMLAGLIRAEVPVYGFQEETGNLEDIFMRITRGQVQ